MDGKKRALVWLRRDLRLEDHTALAWASRHCEAIWQCFVLDPDILDPLKAAGLREDRRVTFILGCLDELDQRLRATRSGAALLVRLGRPVEVVPRLAAELGAELVLTHRDYEPAAMKRDQEVERVLLRDGRALVGFKDQVVFEGDELLSATGKPYSVFTPYKKAWLGRLAERDLQEQDTSSIASRLQPLSRDQDRERPSLEELVFKASILPVRAGSSGAQSGLRGFLERIDRYAEQRDLPAIEGTSQLSVHLRFGTISIRALFRAALERLPEAGEGARAWISELIWREFFFMILKQHPRLAGSGMLPLAGGEAFHQEYDQLEWREGPEAARRFEAWHGARTGYPIVDAAMRQLRQTGFMHNRLRMIVASFLVKDLGLDWRRGERFFAEQLLDFDFSANNGNWQWCASTGCDAQPFFRIFNPVTQSRRFDPEERFLRAWLPELEALSDKEIHAPWESASASLLSKGIRMGETQPGPIVDHAHARLESLTRFSSARKGL